LVFAKAQTFLLFPDELLSLDLGLGSIGFLGFFMFDDEEDLLVFVLRKILCFKFLSWPFLRNTIPF
jgi:hypothetical protein